MNLKITGYIFSVIVILTLVCGISSAATDPTTMPFAPKTTASAPNEDEAFLHLVSPVIEGLSDTSLNSTERIDVQSAYYSATSLKVSPDFYPFAWNVSRLFFYLVSSSEAYEELDKDSGLGTHNPDVRNSMKAQADADISVAEEAYKGLVPVYPNTTLFR